MSDGEPASSLYDVTYSARVRDALARLGREAVDRGDGRQFMTALLEFHRRLCIYPQFGDPLIDLRGAVGHLRLGVVAPLAMRYGVLEDLRSVIVAALPVLLMQTSPTDERD